MKSDLTEFPLPGRKVAHIISERNPDPRPATTPLSGPRRSFILAVQENPGTQLAPGQTPAGGTMVAAQSRPRRTVRGLSQKGYSRGLPK